MQQYHAPRHRRHRVRLSTEGDSSLLMTETNRLIWEALRPYLPRGTTLTCVRRTKENQLAILEKNAHDMGYVFHRRPTVEDESSWLGAYNYLKVAKDAKGNRRDVAKPGSSLHERGLAYDLVGPDLYGIERAVRKAFADGRIHLLMPWTSFTLHVEKGNNCVHVQIDGAVLDFDPWQLAASEGV
jgi:hypothetical protein